MSNDREAAIKRGKSKVDKKAKGKTGKKGAAAEGPSVAGHPRAAAQVRRAKGIGGVGGFALAAFLSHKAGIPPDQVGLRALGAGIAGYLLFWACSVSVWRHLVMAELRALAEETLAAAEAAKRPRVALQGTEQPAPAGEPAA